MIKSTISMNLSDPSMAAPPPPKPVQSTSIEPIFSVPFKRDKQFVGREDIIGQIEEGLRTEHRVSLYGLGGIGYIP
jgi:hypothetical protein